MSRNYKNTCIVCNEEFQALRPSDKTCSPDCRQVRKEDVCRETGRRAAQNKKFKTHNPEYSRTYRLNRFFGLSLEDYDNLLSKQGGGCAVCGKTPEQEKKSLAVDHDHKTGEIFGLLCYRCNHGIIGKIRNPEIFAKASAYLEKGTGLFVPEQFLKGKPKRRRKKNK
jgi:hypothetical protein